MSEEITEKKYAARDYSTLMGIGQIISVIGIFLVIGSVIAIIIGLVRASSSVSDEYIVFLIGLAALPISLFIAVSGEMISCFVSTERNTREANGLLRQILDKMEDKPIQQEEGK